MSNSQNPNERFIPDDSEIDIIKIFLKNDDTNPLVLSVEEAKAFLDEDFYDEEYTFKKVKMLKVKFDNLPEFTGF